MRIKTERKPRRAAFAAAKCALAAVLFASNVFQPVKASAAEAFNEKAVGTVGSDFLNLGAGARALAMGGAYTALAEDASAAYWNPAGLMQINSISATFMKAYYLADITYQYAAYAQRLSPYSVIAGSVLMTDIGEIDQMDVNRTKTGTFRPRDQAYTISYSRGILELSGHDYDVAMGISAKYITSKIVDRGQAWGADFGVMTFHFAKIPYRLGLMIQNIGQGQKFDSDRDSLPINIKFGGSVSPLKNILFAADVIFPKGNQYYFTAGSELTIAPQENIRLNLRAGINTQQIKIDGGTSGFSLGAGFNLKLFSVDYAYVPMGEFGQTHRFSLSFDFPSRIPVFQRKSRSIFYGINEPASPLKK